MIRWAACLLMFVLSLPASAVSPPAHPGLKSSTGAKKPQAELPVVSDKSSEAPSPVRSYLSRAEEFMSKGDWSKAEEQLRTAVRLDPQNADVVVALARALMEQGKEEGAMAVLLGYTGTDLRVTHALGELYVATSQLKEAEQVFMDLSLRQPAESFHRYNLGLVEYRMGKYEMAENAYLRAVELDPKFTDARYNLALLYIRTRDFVKALPQLEEAVRLREDPDYLVNYGVVLRELNRFPSAQSAFERALAIDRNNTLAMNNLGITFFLGGNTAEARKTFDRVLALSPDDATARSYIAKMSAQPPAPAEPPRKPAAVPAEPEKKPDRPAAKPEEAPSPDMDRLRKANKELKDRLAGLEAKMDEMAKRETPRVDAALKKAQDKLEKKGKEPASAPPAPTDELRLDAIQPSGSARLAIDDRLNELQRTLAMARSELEDVRRQEGRGMPAEAGPAEDRLDAADRAVQQLQRQIRQLMIERDLLRAEISSLRPQAALPGVADGRTNINLADLGVLILVPGMDERLAQNVLWYRQNIGPFKSVADLKKVPGMDEAHYTMMVDHVSVGSEPAP